MKKYRLILTLALFTFLFTSCSKHSSAGTASSPKVVNLGVVEILNDKTSRHDLGDGKVCIIHPFILTGQRIALTMAIEETDSAGTIHDLPAPNLQALSDEIVEFKVENFDISLTPHIKQ
jgi:hypothetical protein